MTKLLVAFFCTLPIGVALAADKDCGPWPTPVGDTTPLGTCDPGGLGLVQVQDAVNRAKHGDTVLLPNGEVDWNGVLTVNKDVSIIGAGMDAGDPAKPSNVDPSPDTATIIHAKEPNGRAMAFNFQNSGNKVRLSGIVLELTIPGDKGSLISLLGKCYRKRVGGVVVGGLRVDHMRTRNTADPNPFNDQGPNVPSIATDANVYSWGGQGGGSGTGDFITGSFDHNFIDYKYVLADPLAPKNNYAILSKTGTGSEVNSFGTPGAPNSDPAGRGSWQWQHDYAYGGGDSPVSGSGADTDLYVIYVEDNVFHRSGFNFGTLTGGARFVVRYNTSWGGINGHGIDGSNMGPPSWEYLNNFMQQKNPTTDAALASTRGGAWVLINNRFTRARAAKSEIAGQAYRQTGKTSASIGPASGRNYLDENYRGTQTFTDSVGATPITFIPKVADPVPGDDRVGSIYASGTVASIGTGNQVGKATLNTLNVAGESGLGAIEDKWKNFVLVNVRRLGAGNSGDQGTNTGGGQYSMITASDVSTGTNPCAVRLSGEIFVSNDNPTGLVAGDPYEIRRLKSYFCNPGSGKVVKPSNGGFNNTGKPAWAYLEAVDGKTQYWATVAGAGQYRFGHWNAFNRTRDDPAKTTWYDTEAGWDNYSIMGGGHNNDTPPLPPHRNNDGTGDAYPESGVNDSVTKRVGAHWNAPGGWVEGQDGGDGTFGGVVTKTYGLWGYPNEIVQAQVDTPTITNDPAIAVTSGVPITTTYPGTPPAPPGYQFNVSGFGGTNVTFSKLSGTYPPSSPPTAITLSTSGLLTGTPTGAAANYPNIRIEARREAGPIGPTGDEVTFKDFSINVGATAITVSLDTPDPGATYISPATVSLEATASGGTGGINKVEFFRAGSTTPIGSDTTSPYTASWTDVPAGSYSLTAKATDNGAPAASATSTPAVAITVATPTPTPTPPPGEPGAPANIQVRP